MHSQSATRRQNFVSRIIQGHLLKKFAGYWLVYNLLLWHGLFLLAYLEQTPAAGQQGFWTRIVAEYPRFAVENKNLLFCAAAILPLFLWDALRLTHRIAGPMERFRTALEDLKAGNPVTPLTLRRDDLLVEYQHAFNRYLAHLEAERKSRGGLPFTPRTESESATEPQHNPLIIALESIKAEIQQATNDSTSQGKNDRK